MAEGSLRGRRVLITRPQGQAARLAQLLAAEGATPVEAPAIRIEPPESWEPMDRAIRAGGYDWVIFTSANAVHFFWGRLEAGGQTGRWFARSRLAAIGPETARALSTHDLRPDLVPDEFVAEALIACLADREPLAGKRVLLPRSDIAREALVVGLRAAGALVDQVPAYRTVNASPPPGLVERLRSGQIDAVTFTSSSTVRGVLEMLGPDADALRMLAIACIGPITAGTVREAGLEPAVVAETYTSEGLVASLKTYYATMSGKR